MTDTETKELLAKDKMEAAVPAEPTMPGRIFTATVDIFETDRDITLLADMPGVKATDLNIDLRDDTLTLTGAVAPFEGPEETGVQIEYEIGTYYRQFSLSEIIDQGKIDAQLTDGVLRLSLPKVEKATPRQITVKAG